MPLLQGSTNGPHLVTFLRIVLENDNSEDKKYDKGKKKVPDMNTSLNQVIMFLDPGPAN